MDNRDYQPNSHKFKKEQQSPIVERKKLDKIVSGTVKTKKQSELSKDINNIKTYLFKDVIMPSLKKLFVDLVRDGAEMFAYGTARRDNRGSSTASKISYNKYYDDRDRHPVSDSRPKVGYSHNDIVLESRREAEEVLKRMNELIETYGVVSVADLYDLIGVTANYTDNKYGWTNIRNAEPIRVMDGWFLKLPKVLPID